MDWNAQVALKINEIHIRLYHARNQSYHNGWFRPIYAKWNVKFRIIPTIGKNNNFLMHLKKVIEESSPKENTSLTRNITYL